VEIRLPEALVKPRELPAAALAEAPIYRGGEQLQPWQRSFVTTFLEHREVYGKVRLLLADEVGLGKTLSLAASAVVAALLGDGPVLILCPATLTLQWQIELADELGIPSSVWLSQQKEWLDHRGHRIRTRGPEDIAHCPTQIAIVSTGLIFHDSAERQQLLERRYGTVILDEAHRARRRVAWPPACSTTMCSKVSASPSSSTASGLSAWTRREPCACLRPAIRPTNAAPSASPPRAGTPLRSRAGASRNPPVALRSNPCGARAARPSPGLPARHRSRACIPDVRLARPDVSPRRVRDSTLSRVASASASRTVMQQAGMRAAERDRPRRRGRPRGRPEGFARPKCRASRREHVLPAKGWRCPVDARDRHVRRRLGSEQELPQSGQLRARGRGRAGDLPAAPLRARGRAISFRVEARPPGKTARLRGSQGP